MHICTHISMQKLKGQSRVLIVYYKYSSSVTGSDNDYSLFR